MTTRRQLLTAGAITLGVGGTALLFRTAEQGVFAVGRGPAYALWDTWDLGVGLEPLVAAAVLAANPHDVQPWRFRVTADGPGADGAPDRGVVEVLRDPTRTIGAVDPFLREVYLGLGCAVENLAVTAGARGYEPTVTLLPEGPAAELVARVELERGPVEPSPLADAVPERRTNRHPYRRDERVPAGVLDELDATVADLDGVSVRWLTREQELQTFRDETYLATEAFVADPETSHDSHAWFRHSWAELQREASGLTYDGSLSSRALAALAKTAPDLGEEVSNDGFVSVTRTHVDTAPLAGLVVADRSLAPDETSAQLAWLRSGRLWQRLHLAATGLGVAMHPLNQLAELTDQERHREQPPRFGDVFAGLAGDEDLVPVMPFRTGYATRAATPTPRRPLVDVLDYT